MIYIISVFVCLIFAVSSSIQFNLAGFGNCSPGFGKSSPFPKSYAVTLDDRSACSNGLPIGEQPFLRVNSTQQVSSLISSMIVNGFDAYIISTTDAHQSEITENADLRRAYLTGFNGNPGTAVVLVDGQRALWTVTWFLDQADQQLDCTWLLMRPEKDAPTIAEWLSSSLPSGSVVAGDSHLFGADQWNSLDAELLKSGISLNVETLVNGNNLVDVIWNSDGRPDYGTNPVEVRDISYAGVTWQDKVNDVVTEIASYGADAAIFAELDEIAWLLNIRGSDIFQRPVFRCYLILDATGDSVTINLFVPNVSTKITAEVQTHLSQSVIGDPLVVFYEYSDFEEGIFNISATATKILLPNACATTNGVSYHIYSRVPISKILSYRSPLLIMKASKNDVEIQGMKNAHIRDGVALTAFLSDLNEKVLNGVNITESGAMALLRDYRANQTDFYSIAFYTSTAFGPHGAIIPYLPFPELDTLITDQDAYLLDSGGQYRDGTTDVTRTLHFGTPTDYQKETYTRILQGHIEYASAIFPKGTTRTFIEVLARKYLYEVGLDYVLFTSHGISSFLNHREALPDDFQIGNHVSDEPGYYEDGNFGMRIENIIRVVDMATKYNYTAESYGFEPVTMVPYEPNLIDFNLLTTKQCTYINNYHQTVRDTIGPELLLQGYDTAYDWMITKTEPFTCP